MSNPPYSPGPWHWDERGDNMVDANERIVFYGEGCLSRRSPVDQETANTRLIELAPEMAEAIMDWESGEGGYSKTMASAAKKVREIGRSA